MTYSIKEMFYSLQGEGARSGRPAVFCRFAGCNLWSGEEQHRQDAQCTFCDTDFVGTNGKGGGKFTTADSLVSKIKSFWPADQNHAYVIFTGGEPLLQLDVPLIQLMKLQGFEIGVETNGSIKSPKGIDWLCVSPKADVSLQQIVGDELKLVYPQLKNTPDQFTHLDFQHFYLQPMDTFNSGTQKNLEACVQYCLENPRWKLSQQSHKNLGIR